MFAEVVVPRWMPRAAGWDGGTGGDAKDWLEVKGLNPGQGWGKHSRRMLLGVCGDGESSYDVAKLGCTTMIHHRCCLLPVQESLASPTREQGQGVASLNTSARSYLTWAGVPLPRINKGQRLRG